MNQQNEQYTTQFHLWFAQNKAILGWTDSIGNPSADEYRQMCDLWILSRLEEERCRTDKKEREKRHAQYSFIMREHKLQEMAQARARTKVQEKTLMDFLYNHKIK